MFLRFTIYFFITLVLSLELKAQIPIINTTTISFNASPTTFTYPLTAGTNRALLFLVTAEFDNTTNFVSGVTYGGVATTLITGAAINGGGKQSTTAAFIMVESQLGSVANNTVTLTTNSAYIGGAAESLGVAVYLLSNVNQATPFEDAMNTTLAFANSISTSSINSNVGDLIVYFTNSSGSGTTWVAGPTFTEIRDIQLSNHSFQLATRTLSANAVVTASAINSSTNRLAITSFELNPAIIALPIELLEFKGLRQNSENHLFWETLSEQNTDYFELQYSENALDWIECSKIKATGKSSERLTYNYKHVHNGKSYYYRLKSVDEDSFFQFSKIIYLGQKPNDQVKIYPNEFTNQMTIEFEASFLDIEIFDTNGKVVKKYVNASSPYHISDLGNLAEACYYLTLKNNDFIITKKIIKK